jgi:hypothetical protein
MLFDHRILQSNMDARDIDERLRAAYESDKAAYSKEVIECQRTLLERKTLRFCYTVFDDKDSVFRGSFHLWNTVWHRARNTERRTG